MQKVYCYDKHIAKYTISCVMCGFWLLCRPRIEEGKEEMEMEVREGDDNTVTEGHPTTDKER